MKGGTSILASRVMLPNQKLLRWTGYWPGGTNSISIKEILNCALHLLLNFVFILIPEILFIYQHFGDMIEVSQCISEMLSILLSFIKMWLVLWYRSRINRLIGDMKSKWETDKVEYNTREWIGICEFTEKQSKYLSYCYVVIYVGFGTNFFLNPLFFTAVRAYLNNVTITPAILPTPIKLGYPYDIDHDWFNFWATHLVSDVAVFSTIFILSSFDAFYLTMINYAATFFRLVNVKLANLHKMYDNGEEMQINIMNDLSDIVKHHTTAIEFVNRLEEVSHLFMIIQYLSSTFLLCVVGFQLSIFLENIYQFLRILTYCICLNMQLFTFSWFGSKLMEESANVAKSAYSCQWYDKPLQFQKCMVLIMARSQRSVGISAAKFYLISLESFAKVLSASLSYFTLLQTIYED